MFNRLPSRGNVRLDLGISAELSTEDVPGSGKLSAAVFHSHASLPLHCDPNPKPDQIPNLTKSLTITNHILKVRYHNIQFQSASVARRRLGISRAEFQRRTISRLMSSRLNLLTA